MSRKQKKIKNKIKDKRQMKVKLIKKILHHCNDMTKEEFSYT